MFVKEDFVKCVQCGQAFAPDGEQKARTLQAKRNDWQLGLYCPRHADGPNNWVMTLPIPDYAPVAGAAGPPKVD